MRAFLTGILAAFCLCGSHMAAAQGRDNRNNFPANLPEALAHFAHGKLLLSSNPAAPEAWEQFAETVRLDPSRVDLALEVAGELGRDKRYKDALELLLSVDEQNPNNPRLKLAIGSTCQELEHYDDAFEQFRVVIKLWPRSFLGYIGAAEACRAMGEDRRAVPLLRRGFDQVRDPRSIRLLCDYLSLYYYFNGDYQLSIEYLELLDAASFSDPSAAIRLLGCYLHTGKYAAAAHFLGQAPSALQTNAVFQYEVARTYAVVGDDENAASSYHEAERLATKNPDSATNLLESSQFYFHYGATMETLGRFDEAESLFRKSIELDPRNDQAQNYLAYMWAERGMNLKEALRLVRLALMRQPDSAAYIDTLGWIYFQQRRYPEALEQLQRAYVLVENDPVITHHLGDALQATANYKEALEYWKKSYSMDQENEDVVRKLKSHGINLRRLRREWRDTHGKSSGKETGD